MSMIGSKAYAYDIAVENSDGVTIYYNYINNGTELEVTSGGYSGGYSGNINIPETVTYMNRTRSVTSIGRYAFRVCSSLTSVTIGNSVTTIGSSAFEYCRGLTSVTIGNSVTSIGSSAFADCSGLTSVYISDLAAWCNINFFGIEANPLSIARHLFINGEEIKDMVIPNSVTSICTYAFYGCTGLTSVTIPNSVTTIGGYAFDSCIGLTSVTIPNSVTSIGSSVFSNCSGLTSVTIPNSVTSIGSRAFSYCAGLTSVTIPNSVTSIGYKAFDGWDIPTVVSLIENPFTISGKQQWEQTFSTNTFNNATLYVPVGTIDKYKATEGWKDFLFIEEGTGGTPTTPQKCEKPTIAYKNGKLTFNCETEGATCQSTITAPDVTSYNSNEVQLGVTYNISVYATKVGYDNSDTATATLCWIDVEPKTEGLENGVAQVRANPVLIQSESGEITVTGADDGTRISVYGVNGQQAGSALSTGSIAHINTNLPSGSVAIVKIGEKSVKIVVR